MPRSARAKSETDIYHVMLRGTNQSQLFYDDDDRETFMDRLLRYKEQCGLTVYAYCLMGNHVHLLVKEGETDLSAAIQKLTLSYSYWFNAKYDRSGFLFQGRYRREVVATEAYLLEVVRYIHNNPVKIGESITLWTSYNEYIKAPTLVDTSLVLGLFGDEPATARKDFAAFSKEPLASASPSTNEVILDIQEHTRLKDDAAVELIKEVANIKSCQDLLLAEKDERNRVLVTLKQRGLSTRQLSRLTGINRGVVQRASLQG